MIFRDVKKRVLYRQDYLSRSAQFILIFRGYYCGDMRKIIAVVDRRKRNPSEIHKVPPSAMWCLRDDLDEDGADALNRSRGSPLNNKVW